MSLIFVVASRPLSGKTAIASALARGIASESRVRLLRTGAGPAAEADAETFAGFTNVSTAGQPVALDSVTAGDGETVIVEVEAGVVPSSGSIILVIRGEPSEADGALVAGLGDRVIGTIATNVPAASVQPVGRVLTDAGLRPQAVIPEDRILASPSVGEIRDVLDAEVLYEAENDAYVVDDILLSPVYADPARPHFRRFDAKAILAPFNKTDLHLAAIETQAACLVITGGRAPSPYVVDRARGEVTTVLLTSGETPETLSALSDVWLTSRFRGDRKAAAIYEHLAAQLDIPSLLARLR